MQTNFYIYLKVYYNNLNFKTTTNEFEDYINPIKDHKMLTPSIKNVRTIVTQTTIFILQFYNCKQYI